MVNGIVRKVDISARGFRSKENMKVLGMPVVSYT